MDRAAELNSPSVISTFKMLDSNNDGKVNTKDIIPFLSSLDTDKDKTVSPSELSNIFYSLVFEDVLSNPDKWLRDHHTE